jgi:hypothetical protein
MKVISDRTIREQTVTIDGTEFRNCKFVGCRFSYSGGDFAIVDCAAEGCSYDFFGPASRTIAFLRHLGVLPKDSNLWSEIPKDSKPSA